MKDSTTIGHVWPMLSIEGALRQRIRNTAAASKDWGSALILSHGKLEDVQTPSHSAMFKVCLIERRIEFE